MCFWADTLSLSVLSQECSQEVEFYFTLMIAEFFTIEEDFLHVSLVGSIEDISEVPAGKQCKCLPNDFVIPGVLELAMSKGLFLCTTGVKACPEGLTECVEKTEKLNQKHTEINALPKVTRQVS